MIYVIDRGVNLKTNNFLTLMLWLGVGDDLKEEERKNYNKLLNPAVNTITQT